MFLGRPKSRGWVKLRSTSFKDEPRVNFKFLEHPDDLELFVKGLKKSNKTLDSSQILRKYDNENKFLISCFHFHTIYCTGVRKNFEVMNTRAMKELVGAAYESRVSGFLVLY